MNGRNGLNRGVIGLTLSTVVMIALAASGGNVRQWTGVGNGVEARLYVDGQKATGSLKARLPKGQAQMELSGSGSGERYSGSLRGALSAGGRTQPVTGTWQAALGSGSSLTFTCRAPSAGEVTRSVPLTAGTGGIAPLRIAWLRGSATRKPLAGAAAVTKAGDAIRPGDVIETGANSGAIVVLGDSSVVMMQDSTRLEIPDVPENQKRVQSVKATSGKVWFAVKKVQQGEKFEVETDEAVAAVRGTEFLVEVDDAGELSVTTAEGEVAVTDARRTRPLIPVKAGMAWRHQRPQSPNALQKWGSPKRTDLKPIVQRWGPRLAQADGFWPHRRAGKREFWQDRYLKPSSNTSPPRPGAGRRVPPSPRSRPARR